MMAESLPSSKSLRAGLAAAGKLVGWDMQTRKVSSGYSPTDVRMHCVQNSAWQKVRLSMKGVDTHVKLEILEAWWDKQTSESTVLELIADTLEGQEALDTKARAKALRWATEVQVGNYLGAIRRGGQLDDNNMIRKVR